MKLNLNYRGINMVDTKVISSATKYNLSGKRPDTDKWWSFGNFNLKSRPGKDQPQLTVGIRKTDEFKALINSVDDGGWINLYVFEDSKQHVQKPQDTNPAQPADLGDEIPFALLIACAIGSLALLAPMVA